LTVSDLPGLAAATRAMVLACIVPSPDNLQDAKAPMAKMRLERAKQYINANLQDPGLGNEMLCRALGISRTMLYRLFEPTGGVMRYILHRRLVDAHARLADPSETRRIFEIAEQRGFNDGAEFSRAFRREFGYSPSEVRSRRLGAIPARPAADLASVEPVERLGLLLRRLQS
ncbi:helix-turn-helix domain-containing protein, partial [Rhizobiaceae sp. 2RAB30]